MIEIEIHISVIFKGPRGRSEEGGLPQEMQHERHRGLQQVSQGAENASGKVSANELSIERSD